MQHSEFPTSQRTARLSACPLFLFPLLLATALTACSTSRIEVQTQTDHTFVDVTYDSTLFAMQVRKDTIDHNDNNVLFWGVNPIFAPRHDPARQSLYFSLESNYRDERNRQYMEWNFDSRGTAGQKHRLIHGMIPKDNSSGQLLELRWDRYLLKKAYGDTELVSIEDDGMTVNTPIIRGSRQIEIIGNAVMLRWDDANIFTVAVPKPGSSGFDAKKPLSIDFQGKNSNQTITLYIFSGEDAQSVSWPGGHGGADLFWKDGSAVLEVPANSVAEFTISRIRKSAAEEVYLASLKGIYRKP
ncbi:MAG: hypothetical protein JXA28_00915 [Bacteroidetes bacterium]|nr:hypothetical protein [Bacteroidota bacterium]